MGYKVIKQEVKYKEDMNCLRFPSSKAPLNIFHSLNETGQVII